MNTFLFSKGKFLFIFLNEFVLMWNIGTGNLWIPIPALHNDLWFLAQWNTLNRTQHKHCGKYSEPSLLKYNSGKRKKWKFLRNHYQNCFKYLNFQVFKWSRVCVEWEAIMRTIYVHCIFKYFIIDIWYFKKYIAKLNCC